MALIINGSEIPVNATVSYNGQSVNKIIYRHICKTCGGDGIEENVVVRKHCSACGTDYPPIVVACSTNGCPNFGVIGVLDEIYGDITCRTCHGSGYSLSFVAWERLYTYILTIIQGTGVASVTVTRTFTKNSNASTGILTNGAEIYTDDVLTVSATAETDYELDPFTENYVVSGNITVHITATMAFVVNPPIITTSSVISGSGFSAQKRYAAQFKNDNDLAGTLYYSTDGGSSYSSRSISANTTWTLHVLTLRPGESGTINLKAYVVINGVQSEIVSHFEYADFPL